jgi:NhaP-type Na+/H+ or K+/H+ antiporter
MMQEPRIAAHGMGRRKMWNLFVMIGYAIAAVGFLLLPVAIGWFPIAPILIVGGFSLSLAAYVGRRLRVYMLKKIRQEEREEAQTLLD